MQEMWCCRAEGELPLGWQWLASFAERDSEDTLSLIRFVQRPDVAGRIKPLRPKMPRKIAATLRVGARSKRYSVVGTAFDYLLRFEMQRLVPDAITRDWVADHAPAKLWIAPVRVPPGDPREAEDFDPDPFVARADEVLRAAKTAVSDYRKREAPTRDHQSELAAHALKLAKLDILFRANRLDPQLDEAAPEDVEDLLCMLALAPIQEMIIGRPILLNPTFGDASALVGGADADLIAGDFLIDFKVTTKSEMDVEDLDQLLGYFLLARHHRSSEQTFPEIRRAGIYFGRHAHLWSVPTTIWTNHPEFREIEAWFLDRAKRGRTQS